MNESAIDCSVLENQRREQNENWENQVHGLTLKLEHLQKENNQLQKLFHEKSNVNEAIHQEVTRLSGENSVRDHRGSACCYRSPSGAGSYYSLSAAATSFLFGFFFLFKDYTRAKATSIQAAETEAGPGGVC